MIESPVPAFSLDYDTNYLYDIMGKLTGVGIQKEYERNGLKTKMVAIQLDYDGFKFKVTLFGPYVDELNAFVAAGKTENTIVVVLMAKIKIWQGSATIQNSFNSTKLLFNPEFISVNDLKKRMLEKNDSPSPDICLIHDSNGLSEEEDFLKVTSRITIEGLKESRGVQNQCLCN
ncbi:hypothetical protein P8452_27788 [Trifolium repens]|nr:hypothetical protein P8452_27788 [Trifolium repens]